MMLRNLGRSLTAEGDLTRARQAFDSAVALARGAEGDVPTDLRLIDELSQSFQGLASVEIQQDDPDSAEVAYKQALRYSRIAASSDPKTLSGAAASPGATHPSVDSCTRWVGTQKLWAR